MRTSWVWALGAGFTNVVTALLIAHENVFHDDDLFSYVTMPGVKAPRFNLTVYDPERTTPGYWFVAPYTSAEPKQITEDYKPHQVGPFIYDGRGELVWSGAHLFKDRSVFDFRMTQINGQSYLSFIVNYDPQSTRGKSGSAMILDSSYQPYHEIPMSTTAFNMHEFNVVDDGKSALLITNKITLAPIIPHASKRKITDNGFVDIDLESGKKLFEWSALAHIDPWESQTTRPFKSSNDAWDYVHLNSVDKSKVNGDYIISSRYMDTIYRISAEDGSIVWRLGGPNNSFTMSAGFEFIAQHDARIIDEYNSTVILSFLNNAADDARRLLPTSCGVIAALDTEAMTATLLHTYKRPDKAITFGRGNVQVLPHSHNVFANWADNSYISEYTPDGAVVWEAQFQSKRYVNYRAYKFSFIGTPHERPQLVSTASLTADAQPATVLHVSWNGATQARAWNFYACPDELCESPRRIGHAPRSGFETQFVARGLHRVVFAEAVGGDGTLLGESAMTNTTLSTLSVSDAEIEGDERGSYGGVTPHLLVVAFVAMTLTILWVFSQRRRFKLPLMTYRWRESEKSQQVYWDKD